MATVLLTAFESSPRDVIVAAAFPDSKLPRCRNAEVPGSSRSMTSPGLTMSQRQFSFGFWNNGDWGAVFINGLPTGRKQERCQNRTDAHRVFLKESLITLDLTVCNRRT